MQQIIGGKKLRRVSTNFAKKPKEDLNTVEGVLQHVFNERFAATNYSDSDNSDGSGDVSDSEW